MRRILLLLALGVGLNAHSQVINESFDDGNFTNGTHVWTGNFDSRWAVVPDALGGPDALGSNTLRLLPNSSGNSFLVTPNSSWGTFQAWGIWFGRQRGIDFDNQQYFWLFADNPDLAGPSVNGYRLALIPDIFGGAPEDPIVLQIQRIKDGQVDVTIAETFLQGLLVDIGFVVRVTRDASNGWAIYATADPASINSGGLDPATTSPVGIAGYTNTGDENAAGGQAVSITGTGYVGVQTVSTVDPGADAFKNSGDPEFDQIRFQANGSLPVTLESFKAVKNSNGYVDLSWNVGLESNVEGYEVERSSNGVQFSRIGYVSATGSRSYRHRDLSPLPGKSFYRLKTVDNDDTYAFSFIVGVNFSSSTDFKVFPNPARSQVLLQHPPGVASSSIRLINATGSVIKQLSVSENQIQSQIDLSGLQPGLYMLEFLGASQERFVTRLIKQ